MTEPWPDHVVEGVAQVLGETSSGLTGSEIGRLLAQCGIDDSSSGSTKWRRLCDALLQRQHRDGAANNVIAFVCASIQTATATPTITISTYADCWDLT